MKINKFYLQNANYIAFDESGKRIEVNVNYWEGDYKMSGKNKDLEVFVKKMLTKKHKINLVHKMKNDM